MVFVLFLVFSLFLKGALGEIICKELPVSTCSFSVASSGKRCLLETYTSTKGATEFQCKTSEVYVKIIGEMIESDACVNACGVDRKSVGMSSDSLMEPHFTAKLCSPACYKNCPNIVDLYYNLALGEGVFLPDLCKAQQNMPRRAMSQLLSSGAASGWISAAVAPISAAASSWISASVAPAPAAPGPASSESHKSVACAPTSV
ncbi:hypothetical protein LguiB_000746 [Lonicera macranthoides]